MNMMQAIQDSMQEHWDMNPEFFQAHTAGDREDLNDGWFTLEFNNADGEMVFWVEANAEGEVWNTNFEMHTDDHSAAVTSQWNFENGSTTFRISSVMHFFTTHKDEVEEMVAQFNETGSWAQEK